MSEIVMAAEAAVLVVSGSDGTNWREVLNRVMQERLLRRAHSLEVPERPVHWSWLHGPADRPDPPPREVRVARLAGAEAL